MRYYKQIDNGYITAIGTGGGGTEITETEYNGILTVIRNKPARIGTTDYRLREDLTWEAYQVQPVPEDDEIDEHEAMNILLGRSDDDETPDDLEAP